ncbi:hypothetical protein CDD83_5057 [Cordyceps sp. RAO-2017]|nr:hypothetical protein CDD83_5057 [Cordyceps sp. RAO-2017]
MAASATPRQARQPPLSQPVTASCEGQQAPLASASCPTTRPPSSALRLLQRPHPPPPPADAPGMGGRDAQNRGPMEQALDGLPPPPQPVDLAPVRVRPGCAVPRCAVLVLAACAVLRRAPADTRARATSFAATVPAADMNRETPSAPLLGRSSVTGMRPAAGERLRA